MIGNKYFQQRKTMYKILNRLQGLGFIFLVCLSTLRANDHFYRAAVLELVQFTDLSYSGTEIAKKNLKIYETAAKTASLNGADIIVFPECGLFPPLKLNKSLIFELSEDIPNPKLKISNPCNQPEFENRPSLSKLSCLAKENGIFIVGNMFDKKNCEFSQFCDTEDIDSCTSSTDECPDDGYFFYNTNVVFNRKGELIARYYKRHLYFEPLVKTPDFPEDIYFQTDFGNFTTVICFDLIFKESVLAISQPEVTNLAYPTYWFDTLPFIFFAVSYQQAWAISNKINLLAANVHDPRTGTLGSGIYGADKGALIYTNNPDGRSKLLVSNVPKLINDVLNEIPLNTKRFIIEDNTVFEEEGEEQAHFSDECSIDFLGAPSDALTDYRCFPSQAEQYDYYKLEGKEGDLEVCSNTFCCSLLYQALSMEEEYFLGITGNNLNITTFSYGSEICFLAHCEELGGLPCVNYKLKSNTIFQKVEIKGNFSTQYVYPFAINSGMHLVNKDNWSFNGKSEILYSNKNEKSSLNFLGLYGRIYDQDSN